MSAHKILVIDESMVIRKTVKDMLPPGKFEVIEARDGIQGMELIRNSYPNIIMLDFLSPKMSGWEVYKEIQKNPEYKSIPLLFMSDHKYEVTARITEPFEFFGFLQKPFDQKQLFQGIRDAMEKSKKLVIYIGKSTDKVDDSSAQNNSAMTAEIEQLNAKIVNVDTEITNLKKQLNQLTSFIKQKIH